MRLAKGGWQNVDAIYAELKPKLDTLPAGDVHGPADKNYGQRELLIVGPDGELIVFGQQIPGQQIPAQTTQSRKSHEASTISAPRSTQRRVTASSSCCICPVR